MNGERLAFSTNAFKQATLDEAVRAIAEIGYAGVEIMADVPHMFPVDFSDTQAQELRKLIEGLGMAVSNVNAFTGFGFDGGDTYHPTWLEDDPVLRRQRIDHTRRAIELTAAIGGDCISLQPGGPYQRRDIDRCYALFAEGLSECLDTARTCGVILGIEPEPGLLLERSDQFERLKSAFFADEPLVMMNADLGHFYCCREDPAAVLERCAEVICHVHIEDISDERVHQHLVPGEGAMDFDAIFAALDRIGYDGFVTVELYPYTSTAEQVARDAIQFLRPMLSGP